MNTFICKSTQGGGDKGEGGERERERLNSPLDEKNALHLGNGSVENSGLSFVLHL
jgi:hypothetical protein